MWWEEEGVVVWRREGGRGAGGGDARAQRSLLESRPQRMKSVESHLMG